MVIELKERAARVRFKHPVRVVPLDGSPRIYRTLAANLSRKGMFVRMPEPLPIGTRVALSLEAAGQALPFAEAEIAWCRLSESELPGRYTGFGVRFTSFLNPRAPDLVEYLVKNLDRGRPLKTAPQNARRRRWLIAAAVAAPILLALVVLLSLSPWGEGRGEGNAAQIADDEVAAAPVAAAPQAKEPEVVAAAVAEPSSDDAPAPQEVAPTPAEDVAPPAVAVAPVVAAEEPAPLPKPVAVEPPPAPVAEAKPPAAPAPKPTTESTHGRVALSSGAAKSLSWEARGESVRVHLDLVSGATPAKHFLLAGPPRLVLDLDGKAPKKSFSAEAQGPWLTQVRVGRHGSSTRVVVDLAKAPEALAQDGDGVTLTFAR